MPVNININTAQIAMKIRAAADKAVGIVSVQILADCNGYCPQDQDGALINSSVTFSDIPRGNLVWSTPYARYLYHGLLMVDPKTGSVHAREGQKKVLANSGATTKRSDKVLANPKVKLKFDKTLNPKAGAHWCERARDDKHEEWQELYEAAFRRELNK